LICAERIARGISLEKANRTDESFYHWVATAGEYSSFLDAVLPRYPSACGICLDRGKPQMFRVGQRFFDIMGIQAPLVTDGILLPWQVDGQRGTIFVMAHGRGEAFDAEDCRMMQLLADFAALGVRHQDQQRRRMDEAKVAAAAEMANELAHQINNPLQSLTNVLFLAAEGHGEVRQVGRQALEDVQRLSALVNTLLALPLRDPSALPLRDPSALPLRGPSALPLRGPSALPLRGPSALPLRGPSQGV